MIPAGARATAVIALLGLAVAGGVVAGQNAVRSEIDALQAQVVAVAADRDEVSAEQGGLRAQLADLGMQQAVLESVLDVRDEFGAAVADFEAAAATAVDKVDTASQRAEVVAAQNTVLAERADPAVVVAATAEVQQDAAAVRASVAAYDEEQRRAAAAAASTSGRSAARTLPISSAGGYDRVRAALNTVGGGGVELREFDGGCGGGTAPACASSAGFIMYSPSIFSWSQSRLLWAMAHELAHIHQFRIWGPLTSSAGYGSLFGGNIELLANCMAAARGYPSGNVSCSGAQIDWSSSIWNGSVPG